MKLIGEKQSEISRSRGRAVQDQPKRDLSSVRALVRSVSALARYLRISSGAIYQWIDVNRIPGRHIVSVANFYDVEITELLPLTGSELSRKVSINLKPRSVLETVMEVYQGKLSMVDAVRKCKQPEISLKLILTHWGDRLPTLHTTLEQLDQKRITLDQACSRLGVGKYTMHGIRRKYGYAPGRVQKTRSESNLPQRKSINREIALQCVSGKYSVREAAKNHGVSERTIFRYIEEISPIKMMQLTHWPSVFREALAEELRAKGTQNGETYAEKLLKFVKNNRLTMGKEPKYPKTHENWRNLPLKLLLVGILLGKATVAEIAESRDVPVEILTGLFSGDLHDLGIAFDELENLSFSHRQVVAKILNALMDRKRDWVER